MPHAQAATAPFSLELPQKAPFKALVTPALEKLLCLPTLNSLYSSLDRTQDNDFLATVLNLLGVGVEVSQKRLDNIPTEGPVVVAANHPFGAIEGVILLHVLHKVRPDVKVMANYMLGMVPEMREHIISVDPFGSTKAAKRNIAPLKEALQWTKNGGLLAVFPAGEVSSLQVKKGAVTDPAWSTSVARIARKANAAIVPMHFDGANGPLFHLLGLIHPRLRTMMLPREMLNKRSHNIRLEVGTAVTQREINSIPNDELLTEHLRLRTYSLKYRRQPPRNPMAAKPEDIRPVASSAGTSAIAAEIEAQPESHIMLDQGDYRIICAQGRHLPIIMPELGRLREICFREVGEGTGLARDMDRYDDYYHHLVLWNKKEREIAGAYRLARTDIISEGFGVQGLYTHSLFKYDKQFLDSLGPSLELGRAFVTSKYRKNYNSLMLLWKGIAAFVCKHHRYRKLFGPVSITNDYTQVSKNLMMQYLSEHHSSDPSLANCVKPRTPPRQERKIAGGFKLSELPTLCPDMETLGRTISNVEHDGKGVPVLLRQYLKLGGSVLAFNLDRDFADAIDGLMVVDLTKAPERALRRYMGKDDARMFRAAHSA